MVKIHLSRLLGEKRWTQKDLADATGIRPSTINEWYHELVPRLNVDHIPKENPVGDTEKKEEIKLYLERVIKNVGKIEAQGTVTSEGFIVLKGSQISPVDDNTVPDTIKEQRYSSNIIDGILQEDMFFSSPSGAAMFVVGKSDNGLTRWKDENGRTLKEIENREMMNEN